MRKRSWSWWSIPALLSAVVLLFTGCDYLKATFNRQGYLEEQAAPLVTKLLKRNGIPLECVKVTITRKIDTKNYEARAKLDNGEDLTIKIEDRGDTIWVQIIPKY